MKELEESNCEIRNTIELRVSAWDRLDGSANEDESLPQSNQSPPVPRLGGFLDDGCKFGWLSRGTRLIVFNVRNGETIGSWNFSERISCVSPFPAQDGQVPLILVGLDNDAIRIKDSAGLLCIFDCSTSRILRTIRTPAGVEQACVIHGGTEWEDFNEKRADTILPDNSGLVCVALRDLQHILIDLCRPSWQNCVESDVTPAEIELSTSGTRSRYDKEKHPAQKLMNERIEEFIGFDREDFESTPLYDEKLTNVLVSSRKIGCIISGCLGRVIIWQMNGTVGWISPILDENMYVTHAALSEPTDDPRPFYYLWVACQNESSQMSPVLKMFAMLFERKHFDKGTHLYYSLANEPSLKFELELEEGEKIHGLSAIERENGNQEQMDSGFKHGEDSLLLISTDERMLLFDLNRWYLEQMPRTMAECRNPNSVMSSYLSKSLEETLACTYVPSSLKEYPCKGPSSPEELFYPNSLSIEWVDLSPSSMTFWLARGVQAELLREIVMSGPILLIQPSEVYEKCLTVGLVPFDATPEFHGRQSGGTNEDKSTQREMLLSLCLEQRWSSFLIKCAREWSDGSASYLFPAFLRWGVQRATEIKLIADRLSVPLFDQSGTGIGESEIKTLRFCSQQLECLSNVVAQIPNHESESSDKQRRALGHIAIHLQVLLWFYDVGLLPESQELDETPLQMSLSQRIPYPREKLVAFYEEKRRQSVNGEDVLFIDKLISKECSVLKSQWEREGGSPTKSRERYPPPSLQSLLRSFLTDCYKYGQLDFEETEYKHQITIYLLMDLAMLLQGSYPGVDRLIKYPSAFKLNPGLIKLTQAFWLLDHEDYPGFFDTMTGQLIADSDVKDWHHKLVVETLLRNDRHKLALTYLRVQKPPLSSFEDRSNIIGLSVELGLLQSAFHRRPPSHYSQLLTRFFQACKTHGKLGQILHLALDAEEEEAFVEFLRLGGCEETRLLYYLQRCRHTEASDVFSIERRSFLSASKIKPISLKMLGAYNATLPEITKRFATLTKKRQESTELDSRFPRPMSHKRSNTKEIHEVAVEKVRETYLGLTEKTYTVPFLGAPCSALFSLRNICSRSDTTANCVLFPDKKPVKRQHDEMQEGQVDEETMDRKRRKLSENPEVSLVCNTPLVKRKTQVLESTEMETPHSILKIRQMIRSSRSPSVGPLPDNTSKKVEPETKPQRQIRFSIDRVIDDASSVLEDSRSVATIPEESLDKDDDVQKTKEVNKSALSGPHPRPSLRRSPILSFSAEEGRKSVSPIPSTETDSSTQVGTLTPIYSASILSANSSVDIASECSQSSVNNNNETQSGDDRTVMEVDDYGLDKASVISIHSKSTEAADEEFGNRDFETEEFESNELNSAEVLTSMEKSRSPESSEEVRVESSNENSVQPGDENSVEPSNENSVEPSNENSVEPSNEDSTALSIESIVQSSVESAENSMEMSGESTTDEFEDENEESIEDEEEYSSNNSRESIEEIDLRSSEEEEEIKEKPTNEIKYSEENEIEEINIESTDEENGKQDTEESEKEDTEETGMESSEESEENVETNEDIKDVKIDEGSQGEFSKETSEEPGDEEFKSLNNSLNISTSKYQEIVYEESYEMSALKVEEKLTFIRDPLQVTEIDFNITDDLPDEAPVVNSEAAPKEDPYEFTDEASVVNSEEVPKKDPYEFTDDEPSVLQEEVPKEDAYELVLNVSEGLTDEDKEEHIKSTKEEESINENTPVNEESRETVPVKNETEDSTETEKISVEVSVLKEPEPEKVKEEIKVSEDIEMSVEEKTTTPLVIDSSEEMLPPVNVSEANVDSANTPESITPSNTSENTEAPISMDTSEKSPRGRPRKSSVAANVSESTPVRRSQRRSSMLPQLSSTPSQLGETSEEKVESYTPILTARSRRSSSLQPQPSLSKTLINKILDEKTMDSPIKTPRGRPRRASSLQPQNPAMSPALIVTPVEGTPNSRRRSSQQKLVSPSIPEDREVSLEKDIDEAPSNSDESLTSVTPTTRRRGRPSKAAERTRLASLSKDGTPLADTSLRRSSRRAASVQKDINLESIESQKSMSVSPQVKDTSMEMEDSLIVKGKRGKRGASVSKDLDKSVVTKATRSTRGASVLKDTANEEEATESIIKRSTRASSVSKGDIDKEEVEPKPTRSLRGSSVSKQVIVEDEKIKEPKTTRATRALSVSKESNDEIVEPKPTRSLRGSSVSKETVKADKVPELKIPRATRLLSVSKEAVEEDQVIEPKSKRATRGSTSKKVLSEEEKLEDSKSSDESKEENVTTKTTRKLRGSSIPKEVNLSKSLRSKRASSLAKDVILEEDVLERVSQAEEATGSPATNTRRRRMSIQSIPEEVEEVPSTKSKTREKRAASVDYLPSPGKRVTRRNLAKSAAVDTIPEEPVDTQESKSVRRKRAASVSAPDTKKEDIPKTAKVKKSRKTSQSNDKSENYSFSPPEETSLQPDDEDLGETPSFQFSQPHNTKSQK